MREDDWSISVVAISFAFTAGSFAAPVHLRTNYRETPLGIGSEKPRFFWQNDSTERGWKQTAYRLMVASDAALLEKKKPDVWDSGRRASDESIDVAYGGKALLSGHRYYWAVEVWSKGKSEVSAPTWFEMGLLKPTDWSAKWITGDGAMEAADHAAAKWIVPAGTIPAEVKAVVFRRTITLTKPAYRASLSVIANGAFHSSVNGRPIRRRRAGSRLIFMRSMRTFTPGRT